MLGPWGEQHTTSLALEPHNYFILVEKWGSSFPVERTLSVRRPLYCLYWYNEKYEKEVGIEAIDTLSPSDFVTGNFVYDFMMVNVLLRELTFGCV
jgi:hypothetical protein